MACTSHVGPEQSYSGCGSLVHQPPSAPQDGHWKNSPDCGALKAEHQTAVTGTPCTERQGTAQEGGAHRQAGLGLPPHHRQAGNTGHAQETLKNCQERGLQTNLKGFEGHRGKVKSGSCQDISCCSWLRMGNAP